MMSSSAVIDNPSRGTARYACCDAFLLGIGVKSQVYLL